ncbi:MAG: PP2C family protein-serine/threonine phosphatase, partial [Anaerolineales bacterium]
LHCILLLMEQDIVPRSGLPLPLSPDLDPLYLTGVVERTEGDGYRLANLIYRRFLKQHFSPARVGHVLAMAGLWDSAIDYLEASIKQGNQRSQTDVITAIINAIYASQDLNQAVHFFRRGLRAAFEVHEAKIWYHMPQEKHLHLIGSPEVNLLLDNEENFKIPIAEDRLEARAFRQQIPLRSHEIHGKLYRAIPLAVPGSKPIGVVTISGDLGKERFSDPREIDFQLLGFLNQAARALYTVSLRRQELIFAGRVQGSLLPETLPQIPNWQIAATWKPAHETSGDFYDFISLPGGRLGIVIADVVDKGMGAALLMTMSRTLIRSYAGMYTDLPGYLLAKVNRRIITDLNAGLFVTLFYGVLNVHTGKLTYCNAGHPPPILVVPGRKYEVRELKSSGMPLGISEETEWISASVIIPPGSCLLLYTDGVIEAQNQRGDYFGQEQIIQLMEKYDWRSPDELQDKLISAVYEFSGDKAQLDDITLMVLSRDIPKNFSMI